MLSRALFSLLIFVVVLACSACAEPVTQVVPPPESISSVSAPRPSVAREAVESGRGGRSVVFSALAAINSAAQPLKFTMTSDSLDQEGNLTVRTHAAYANINKFVDEWLVSGTYFDPSRGLTFAFDSRYESTCMRAVAPEDEISSWMYLLHRGWRNKDNPGRWTPPVTHIPVYFTPMPDWKVMARAGGEVVITYDVEPGKNFSHIVHVDNETHMVTRVESYRKVGNNHHGQILGIRDYSRYGVNAVGSVHRNRSDCLSRNS